MVSARERARLIECYRDEHGYAAAVLVKCAACLFVLCGLVVIGASVDPSADVVKVPPTRIAPSSAG
jgi:hypothetical protein